MKQFFRVGLAAFVLFAFASNSHAQYCMPTYSMDGCNCPSTWDHIDNVWTTGGITDISNLNSACTGMLPNNYTYFASQVVTALPGQTFSINVQGATFGAGCANEFAHGFKVWVDWNNDGDFTDAGEDVWNSGSAGIQVFTGTITVPLFATGNLRMRVRSAYANVPVDPCGMESYGECEDYNLSTTPPVPCTGQPEAGFAANSSLDSVNTGNTFILSTDSGYSFGGGIVYQWQVNDGSGWSNLGPTSNLPNLNAGSANSPITFVSGQTDSAQYQLIVSCTNSGLSDTTLPVTVNWLPIDYCGTTVTAFAGMDSLGGIALNTVQFNASNISMSGTFEWNFGDGTTENSWAWTTHTYAQSGSYNVCVIYTDSFYLCADTTCVTVVIDSFATVTGTVFLDQNQNGVQDAGEPGIANQQISNPYGAWINYAYSDANGDYTTYVVPGAVDLAYNMSSYVMGGWTITTPNPLTVNADSANTTYGDNDFGVYVDSGYTDYGIDSWCWNTVPGFTSSANMTVQNYGFTANTVTVLLHYDSLLSYSTDSTNFWWLGSNVTPVSVDSVNNVISFEFTMLPGETIYLSAGLYCPVGTPLGTPVYNWATVTVSGATDGYALNDTSACQQTVVGSYDPNDKQVNPAGEGPLHAINPNHVDELTYTIRFQNTGTYLATNVLVTDTLDASTLNVSSVRLIAHSHPGMLEVVEGNVLKMHFDNIMLPDSFSNEPASHGFFTFGIELLPGLQDGSVISNQAAIYFDFNEPVITNSAFVTLDQNLSVHELLIDNDYTVYPNPVDKLLSIVYTGNGRLGETYLVTDITGRIVSTDAFGPSGKTLIDVSKLNNGMYCVQVESKNGLVTKKFSVLH